jgi:flagella basal body P-ring formation protein FlgA
MRFATALLILAATLLAPGRAEATDPRADPSRGTGADSISSAIVDAVRQRMGEDAAVTVTDVDVRGGLIEPPVSAVPSPGARTGATMRFQLVGPDRNGRVRVIGWATARVDVAVEHVRVRQLVSRGQALADEDLEVATGEVAGLPLRWLPRRREVLGARALTTVGAGSVLTKTAVATRPAVKSGQTVRAMVRVGRVHVEAELVAVQDGDPGATVRVVNRDSRRELRARVVEPGVVEVLND